MVTLKLFGDESADATKSRVFAVAGVIGSESEWTLAETAWTARTGGKPFHANVCESEFVRDPDRQKHKDNLRLYEELTRILAGSHLVGFASALALISHREYVPQVLADVAYYKCLTDVIGAAGRTARRFNERPSEEDDVRLEFTFDSRLQSDGAAGTVYKMLRNQREWAGIDTLDTKVSFEDGPLPRLEMGDLLARESMKELDRKITNARPKPRASYVALDETRKFKFIEHDREYCAKWREMLEQPEARAMWNAYEKWLSDTGRVQNGRPHDNMTNRALFYTWFENHEEPATSGEANGVA